MMKDTGVFKMDFIVNKQERHLAGVAALNLQEENIHLRELLKKEQIRADALNKKLYEQTPKQKVVAGIEAWLDILEKQNQNIALEFGDINRRLDLLEGYD